MAPFGSAEELESKKSPRASPAGSLATSGGNATPNQVRRTGLASETLSMEAGERLFSHHGERWTRGPRLSFALRRFPVSTATLMIVIIKGDVVLSFVAGEPAQQDGVDDDDAAGVLRVVGLVGLASADRRQSLGVHVRRSPARRAGSPHW